jgi:hypothetical protein
MRTLVIALVIVAIVLVVIRLVATRHGAQTGAGWPSRYACSIRVPQNSDENLARPRITMEQAVRAAQTAVAGQVHGANLNNENGCLVYSIGIRTVDGRIRDVKVDAGTGAVLRR